MGNSMHQPVGIQFIIFGDFDENSLTEKAEFCAHAGYDFAELPLSTLSIDPAVIRKCLDEARLELRSIHVGYRSIQTEDRLKNMLQYVRQAGAPILISSGFETEDGALSFESYAQKLQEIGRVCSSKNIQFHHHIFDWDLEGNTFTGKRCVDCLLEGTTSKHVQLILDLFWAHYAGEDPVKLVRTLEDRCNYYHLKNGNIMEEDGIAGASFSPLDEGIVDVAACVKEILNVHSSPVMVVEQDRPTGQNSELEDVRRSRDFLRRFDRL